MTKDTRKRYFGIVKLPRGHKACWFAKEDKHGWALGYALNSRTVWLRGLRFADRQEIQRASNASVVYIHLKNSKEVK